MVTATSITVLCFIAMVLLIAAASYIQRGAPRRGAFLVLLGGILVALTTQVIYPSLKATNGGFAEASYASEIDRLRAERDALAADLLQKARNNEALSKTSAFFNKLHRERLIRIADEIETVKGIVLGPSSGMKIDASADVPVTSVVDGAAGFDTIIGELRQLKSLRVRQPSEAPALAMLGPSRAIDGGTSGVIVEPPGPAAPAVTRLAEEAGAAISETTAALRRSLDATMGAPAYQITPADEPELIVGRPGRYYVIELKNPKTANRFSFDGGRYTFHTVGPLYAQAFQSFESDVLKQLNGRVKYELYVRSNADSQSYRGSPEPGHEYKTLTYLPSTAEGNKYLGNPARLDVTSTITNAELPNMRGEYLKRLLSETFKSQPIEVLEGQIVKKDAPSARSAELVLYVAW